MLDKNKILQYFGDEDKNSVINLYEKYQLALDKDMHVFGNCFYSPNVWMFFKRNFERQDFKISADGFFNEAERRMITFNNKYETPFPYKVIKIENTSKFNDLNHKDYLGAILSLGINRNKIGDLLVKNNFCYLPLCDDIEEFLITNLTTVGRVSCKVQLLDEVDDIPEFQFIEDVILIQSLRIDSIVSKLARVSRGKSQMLINEGKVLVDYNRVREKSLDVTEGTRVTIRGIGKFIILEIVGNSKSGKLKLLIKKYS